MEVSTVSTGQRRRTSPTFLPRFLLPEVDAGCFCCDLDTCCKVQGWYIAIVSGLGALMHLGDLTLRKKSGKQELYLDDPFEMTVRAVREADPWFVSGANVVLISIDLVLLVCAVLFLKGLREKRPELMIHYIRMLMASVVFYAIYSVIKAIESRSVMLFIFLILVTSGLQYYMLMCSSSMHFKMRNSTESIEMPTTYPPPPYAGTATGYVPHETGYGPPGIGYGPPGIGYAPPGSSYTPMPAPHPQDGLFPTKPLDGSSPTMV